MILFHATLILTFISHISSHMEFPVPNATHPVPLSKACEAGIIAVNDCNKCVCTSDHYFNCVSKPCNQTVTKNPNNKPSCKPNVLYIKNVTACLCKNDASWPHETCESVFNSFQHHTKTKSKNSCVPNSFVIVECNVCKCGPNGKINKKRCTKKICKPSQSKSRRFMKQNQVYGSCEAQNWYSLAPCQFCFCISENKLVCNTGNNYSKKLQLGSYNLSICGKELIRDAINLIPDRDKMLRFGINKTVSELDIVEMPTQNSPNIELNRENNENVIQQQIPDLPVVEQQQLKNTKDSEEFYTDSEETKAQLAIEREASSTKLPYEEDENNPSSDSENENQAPADEPFAIDIESPNPTDAPAANVILESDPLRTPASAPKGNFPEHFEFTGQTSDNGQNPEGFNLGDVLKPYLPVVLDKVFQMALRKSMVSIDAHSNCTPGATTVYKCNACFCLKNNKLLCTSNECK